MKWMILFFVVSTTLGWVWCLGQAGRPKQPIRYVIFHVAGNMFVASVAGALLYWNRSSDLYYLRAVMVVGIVWCSLAMTGVSVRRYFLMRREEYRD